MTPEEARIVKAVMLAAVVAPFVAAGYTPLYGLERAEELVDLAEDKLKMLESGKQRKVL